MLLQDAEKRLEQYTEEIVSDATTDKLPVRIEIPITGSNLYASVGVWVGLKRTAPGWLNGRLVRSESYRTVDDKCRKYNVCFYYVRKKHARF